MTVPNRDDWFESVHDFDHPIWRLVDAWMRVFVPRDALHEAWQQFVRHWLERLRAQLGGAYTVAESPNFHFLSDATERERVSFLAFMEEARSHIRRVLGNVGTPEGPGKHVVLRFSDCDNYYDYISHNGLDGEQAMSGGMFLNEGYMHIAFPASDRPDVHRRTLVHELSHNLLAHLPLPPWLNEALAMAFESDLAGSEDVLNVELATRHRDYWNPSTIQAFWQGAAIYDVEGQELAYSLARILLQSIHSDVRPAPDDFRKFVIRADAGDAGAVAAREHLGMELGDLVACFLGPGDWAPQPKSWEAFTQRAKLEFTTA